MARNFSIPDFKGGIAIILFTNLGDISKNSVKKALYDCWDTNKSTPAADTWRLAYDLLYPSEVRAFNTEFPNDKGWISFYNYAYGNIFCSIVAATPALYTALKTKVYGAHGPTLDDFDTYANRALMSWSDVEPLEEPV